jgi:hypothetical protein
VSTHVQLELSAAPVTLPDPVGREPGGENGGEHAGNHAGNDAENDAGNEDSLKGQVQDVANRVIEMARPGQAARPSSKSH